MFLKFVSHGSSKKVISKHEVLFKIVKLGKMVRNILPTGYIVRTVNGKQCEKKKFRPKGRKTIVA
jgi:hypothetical protein